MIVIKGKHAECDQCGALRPIIYVGLGWETVAVCGACLRRALAKLEKEAPSEKLPDRCAECGGIGTITVAATPRVDVTHDCPECSGTGVVS